MIDDKEFFIFRLSGSSMMPKYPDGIMLDVKRCCIEDIRRNDIIVFSYENKKIVHRCVRKKKNFIITKGDNLIFPDKPVKAEQVIGKVTGCSKRYVKMPLIKYYSFPYPLSSILIVIHKFIKNAVFRHSMISILMNTVRKYRDKYLFYTNNVK